MNEEQIQDKQNKLNSQTDQTKQTRQIWFKQLDPSYAMQVGQYKKLDAYIALCFYIALLVVYYVMGYLFHHKQIYLGVSVNLGLAGICLAIVIARKQPFDTVGLTIKHFKQSCLLGGISGLLVLLLSSVLPNLLMGSQFIGIFEILYQIFYFFVVIGFVEELIFRGYLQTRIHALIPNETCAVLITGILFVGLHIPFQMAANNMHFFDFLSNNALWLCMTFLWHFVFYSLYRKYNSIVAGTLFHGFMNLGSRLFR